MKWKAKTSKISTGMLELGEVTFDEDSITLSIDICDMSENLKAEVTKAIELAKAECSKNNKKLNAENGYNLPTVWSDQPVIMDYTYLCIELKSRKTVHYSIKCGFHDATNPHMESWDCSIAVDLSNYIEEIKSTIIKVLTDKFF